MTVQEFEHIALTLRPQLMGVARGFFADEAKAEDVVQDVLLRLWQMRDRIEELKRYNDYLRDEVATQHGKYLATKKQSELLFTRIDLAQKKLFKKVHESRRDDDASIFAIGWNQAIGHVEAMIVELLGVDDKAVYEEFGI